MFYSPKGCASIDIELSPPAWGYVLLDAAAVILPRHQDLFAVFVINVQCPLGDVDIMAEPGKSWVEFADWPAAEKACIAMLLVSCTPCCPSRVSWSCSVPSVT